MDIKLIEQNGEHAGHALPVDVPVFVIGRNPSCHHRIDSDRVSHRHCRIFQYCGRVTVEDLDSSNGTMLNDHPIRRAEVQDGDRLKVGPSLFRFALTLEPGDIRSMPSRWSGRAPGGGTTTKFDRPIAPAAGRPRSVTAGSATSALSRADLAHVDDGAEGDAPPPTPRAAVAQASSAPRDSWLIRLIVRCAGCQDKAIAIEGPRFLIGRHPQCQLRPRSQLVSRMHAAIERRDGRVFVRDLGTMIGTGLNGRLLQSEEAEAFDGDRLQVGPLAFTLKIGTSAPDIPPKVEELVADWLHEQVGAGPGPPPSQRAGPALRISEGSIHVPHLRYEFIQDVLVVTILIPDLGDESTVNVIRNELATLLEQSQFLRVVLSFDQVTQMSCGAAVMLMGHQCHLGRVGGMMRFCHIRPAVKSVLEQIHALTLVEDYPTADEAVLAAWVSTGT